MLDTVTRRKRNGTDGDQPVTVIALRPGQRVTLTAPPHDDAAPPGGGLLGTHELAALLGVSRQRAHQLAAHPTFPAPAADLRIGRVWRTDDIRAWASDRGRALSE
jgi:prophage regulatory protein